MKFYVGRRIGKRTYAGVGVDPVKLARAAARPYSLTWSVLVAFGIAVLAIVIFDPHQDPPAAHTFSPQACENDQYMAFLAQDFKKDSFLDNQCAEYFKNPVVLKRVCEDERGEARRSKYQLPPECIEFFKSSHKPRRRK